MRPPSTNSAPPGVHDGDTRPVPLDRHLDLLVPDRVAGEVEVVEDEAAHRREQLGDASAAVACRSSRDREAVPRERVRDRTCIEPELAQRLLVLGLAEDRDVARQELLGARVEVVAVPMRDDDRVEPANDLLGRERQAARSGSRPGCASARSAAARPRRRASDPRGCASRRARRSRVALRTSVMRTQGSSLDTDG